MSQIDQAAAYAALMSLTKAVGIALALLDDDEATSCHSGAIAAASRDAIRALEAVESVRMAPDIAKASAEIDAAQASLRG